MRKNTMSKKLIEQQIMLKIRFHLLLAEKDLPAPYQESMIERIECGLKALEDRLSVHNPSAWFQAHFVNSMAYYGGYCWSACRKAGKYKVEILSQLPEHQQEVAQ